MKHYTHKTFIDHRGSYTPISTTEAGIAWEQCSISINENIYTFRGMHYQTNPPQAKYIKVVQGKIIDFAYNIDTNHLNHMVLGTDDAVLLDNTVAHGFLTLEPNTIVAYLVLGTYNPSTEHSIVWTTIPELKSIIDKFTEGQEITISEKDAAGKPDLQKQTNDN